MKRRRNTTDVLDWEELEEAPNTRGAFSFLRPQSTVINIQEHRQQEPVDPSRTGDKTSTVDKPPTVDVTPVTTTLLNRARPYKIHRCYTVQDGHSAGENQLHAALWRAGTADPSMAEDPDTKRVTVGWVRMARKAGMSDKAAKRNLTYLIEKLAVEVISPENSATRTGRTYRIYSYAAILKRRKDAAMLYVVRDKGVRFLSEAEALQSRPTEVLVECHKTFGLDKTSTVAKTSTVDIPSLVSVDKTSTDRVDKTSPDTVDKTTTPLRKPLSMKEKETTTTDVELSPIVQALSQYVIADEPAARQIAHDTWTTCESARVEEIVTVIHEKAHRIVRDRSITNPLGMLIRAVPKCFEGAGITILRKQWAGEKERKAQQEQESERRHREFLAWVRKDQDKYEAILADPDSTEQERARARKELVDLNAAVADD